MEKTQQTQDDLNIYIEHLMCIVQEDLLVLNEVLEVVDASQSFYKSFDLLADEVKGQSVYSLNDARWDTPELHQLLEDEMKQQDMVYDYVVHQQFDEGDKRVLHINACNFGYVQGIGRTYILTLRDSTQAYREKQQLRDNLDDLQDKNDALDAFAHTVAHDLKNPVSSMIGFAGLIKTYSERMSEAEILSAVDSILESGYHIREIIDSTLMLAMLDRSDSLDVQALNMHEILEQVETTLNSMLREADAHVTYPDEWHDALGYDQWIKTVWMNYISNAIKYGGRPPRIELGSEKLDDGRVKFWVRDNGNGIEEAYQEAVFQSFTRLDNRNSVDKNIEGHGLGLAVVKKIMTKLGGEVLVESQLGHGSTFGFILPASNG